LRPDKTEAARGEDFYELAPDGRIKSVTGFSARPRLSNRSSRSVAAGRRDES
jgi:hypothetical protein